MVRTRTAAAVLATSGRVRVNGQRITLASRAVHPGDVVTVALDRSVRVLRVVGFAERRGSASEACALMEEVLAKEEPTKSASTRAESATGFSAEPPGARPHGEGRPTKRERRLIDRFTGEDEI